MAKVFVVLKRGEVRNQILASQEFVNWCESNASMIASRFGLELAGGPSTARESSERVWVRVPTLGGGSK